MQSGVEAAELLAIAERAASAAADLLAVAGEGRPEARRKGDGRGVVTELDRAAETRIREEILAARPDDRILGEELAAHEGRGGVEWIVDPIDGTNNFVVGLPQWSISIAARVEGRIEAGVVRLPEMGRTFTARAGAGARCNGLELRAGPATALEDAVVATGFASALDVRDRQAEQLKSVLGAVRDVRCQGAASLELCSVAAGELDGYYESGLQLWDVAAAGLVAVEAGIDVFGDPWQGSGTLVAAPAGLAAPLRRLVNSRPGS